MVAVNSRIQVHDGQHTAKVDFAGYLGMIDVSHNMIHEGTLFSAVDEANISTDKLYRVATPNSGSAHFSYYVKSDGKCSFRMYESASITTTGTIVQALNANRTSVNNTSLQVFKDPTIAASGTLLNVNFIGSEGSGHATGAGQGGLSIVEYILKPDMNYILKITPAATINVSAEFVFGVFY